MKTPQFALKDLFWSVGLLSLACFGISAIVRVFSSVGPMSGWNGLIDFTVGLPTPIWLCMGLAAPFRRKTVGAAVGTILMCLIFYFWPVIN